MRHQHPAFFHTRTRYRSRHPCALPKLLSSAGLKWRLSAENQGWKSPTPITWARPSQKQPGLTFKLGAALRSKWTTHLVFELVLWNCKRERSPPASTRPGTSWRCSNFRVSKGTLSATWTCPRKALLPNKNGYPSREISPLRTSIVSNVDARF